MSVGLDGSDVPGGMNVVTDVVTQVALSAARDNATGASTWKRASGHTVSLVQIRAEAARSRNPQVAARQDATHPMLGRHRRLRLPETGVPGPIPSVHGAITMRGVSEWAGPSIKRLTDPSGWVAVLTNYAPRRLVVFVHGFRGNVLGSWMDFPDSYRMGDWWRESDLLFVGYDSLRETIAGVAGRLRTQLPRFYPQPPKSLVEAAGIPLRDDVGYYESMIMVGHSLGGVVVRRAVVDAAQEWIDRCANDPRTPKPAILGAQIRLFSPASAGFQAAGLLGVLKASPGWWGLNMYLRNSSAYSDLQPGSLVLAAIRSRTEQLVELDATKFSALRARILWANPEDVVISERYDTDYVEAIADNVSHKSVCKPRDQYLTPWVFVERGLVP